MIVEFDYFAGCFDGSAFRVDLPFVPAPGDTVYLCPEHVNKHYLPGGEYELCWLWEKDMGTEGNAADVVIESRQYEQDSDGTWFARVDIADRSFMG